MAVLKQELIQVIRKQFALSWKIVQGAPLPDNNSVTIFVEVT